jgi:DedD protein
MADTQEVQQLKRRARRRLVGAIALVLFLVIVPPMLMDLEPKPVTTDLTVEIPSQPGGQVKTPPPAQVTKAEPTADAATSPSGGSSASAATEKAAKAEKTEPAEQADKSEQPAKAAADESKSKHASPLATATVDPRKAKEAQRVESILKGNAFVVPLGAYSNPENVKQLQSKLARAGVKSYTEPVKGASSAQTRVAAGPFATREEAEQARQKLASLKGLGVVPGVITTRQ